MPRFSYRCSTHGEFQISLDKRAKTAGCPRCGGESRAIVKAGTMQLVERLDNGLMPRAVERLHNIEEIMAERDSRHGLPEEDDGNTED